MRSCSPPNATDRSPMTEVVVGMWADGSACVGGRPDSHFQSRWRSLWSPPPSARPPRAPDRHSPAGAATASRTWSFKSTAGATPPSSSRMPPNGTPTHHLCRQWFASGSSPDPTASISTSTHRTAHRTVRAAVNSAPSLKPTRSPRLSAARCTDRPRKPACSCTSKIRKPPPIAHSLRHVAALTQCPASHQKVSAPGGGWQCEDRSSEPACPKAADTDDKYGYGWVTTSLLWFICLLVGCAALQYALSYKCGNSSDKLTAGAGLQQPLDPGSADISAVLTGARPATADPYAAFRTGGE